MSARLPTKLEVGGLLRIVSQAGGFATVLHKGEPDGGAILLVLIENGANQRIYERMPSLDGDRIWTLQKQQGTENNQEFSEYLTRRAVRDPDLWIVELDIANGERFIGLTPPAA